MNPAPTCSPREGGWCAILSFQYPEGSKLDEVRPGTRLGVSRTPVREALGRLEREGLVIGTWREGMRVATLDDATILELLEVQEVVGPSTATTSGSTAP